jgi:hypothetical protein
MRSTTKYPYITALFCLVNLYVGHCHAYYGTNTTAPTNSTTFAGDDVRVSTSLQHTQAWESSSWGTLTPGQNIGTPNNKAIANRYFAMHVVHAIGTDKYYVYGRGLTPAPVSADTPLSFLRTEYHGYGAYAASPHTWTSTDTFSLSQLPATNEYRSCTMQALHLHDNFSDTITPAEMYAIAGSSPTPVATLRANTTTLYIQCTTIRPTWIISLSSTSPSYTVDKGVIPIDAQTPYINITNHTWEILVTRQSGGTSYAPALSLANGNTCNNPNYSGTLIRMTPNSVRYSINRAVNGGPGALRCSAVVSVLLP